MALVVTDASEQICLVRWRQREVKVLTADGKILKYYGYDRVKL